MFGVNNIMFTIFTHELTFQNILNVLINSYFITSGINLFTCLQIFSIQNGSYLFKESGHATTLWLAIMYAIKS